MTSLSAVFFLSFTFLLSFWVGSAFRYALMGIGAGAIIGLLGLALTRWDSRPEGLFYTPSRWLAFLIVFAIAARVLYGWWHATHSGSNAPGDQHWLTTASGTQLSLAVAAGLIGYYLVYSIGVRLKIAMASRPSESGVRVLTNVHGPRRDNRRTRSALLNSSFLILAWRVCRYVLRNWRR
jgi:hypothetical protein